MKLENEPGFVVQSPPRKSYNPFESDDEDNSDGYLKSNNIKGFDIRNLEEDADSLTFHLDNPDISWEEAVLGHPRVVSREILADANGGGVVCRKDTDLFTDKNVTECDLPELMVCYRESPHSPVKDIGVDEGVPTHERVRIKSSSDAHETKNLSQFLAFNGDAHGVESLGNEDHGLSFLEELKSGSEAKSQEDLMKGGELDSDECGADDSKVVDVGKKETDQGWEIAGEAMKAGVIVDGTNGHKLGKADDNYDSEGGRKGDEVPEDCGKDDIPSENIEESSTSTSIFDAAEATEGSTESQAVEATPSHPTSQEPTGSGNTNALPYNSKVESGSIILDFNSSSAVSGKEEGQDKESEPRETFEKAPMAQTMSRIDEGASASSSFDRRVHGETSFSAALPLPASITYMGPHAHNGSISLRSESSAGSTRSFAFPVLQAEWNSSPVRMAKAEPKHFHKHRGWVHSIMCCRF